jgi:hypothetical protein
MEKIFTPYKSDKKPYKFFVYDEKYKKIYFGATGYEHFTEGHLDENRKLNYLRRHLMNENWDDPNSKGFWSARYLWLYPTYDEAMKHINNFIKNNYY